MARVSPLGNTNSVFKPDENLFKPKEGQKESFKEFRKMLDSSSRELQQERESEKNALGTDGTLNLDRTDSAKEFTEMLESITGKEQTILKNKLEENDYLNLLVTELQHQDPTKPMENKDMATQMAQLNSIEQLKGIKTAISSLADTQKMQGVNRMTGWIGKSVEVNTNKIHLGEKDHSAYKYEVPTGVSQVFLEIKNAAGHTVKRDSITKVTPGTQELKWSGYNDEAEKLKAGVYSVEILGMSKDGKEVPLKGNTVLEVESVVDINDGGKLKTKVGRFAAEEVNSISSKAAALQSLAAPPPKPEPPKATGSPGKKEDIAPKNN